MKSARVEEHLEFKNQKKHRNRWEKFQHFIPGIRRNSKKEYANHKLRCHSTVTQLMNPTGLS